MTSSNSEYVRVNSGLFLPQISGPPLVFYSSQKLFQKSLSQKGFLE